MCAVSFAGVAAGPVTIGFDDEILRLAVAAFLGGVLGAEREFHGQDAGFRTHSMLALGAATFGLVSVGAFDMFASSGGYSVDPTRIASYVAAGIGFLGGGTILKHAGGVRGLTTAASLWVAAAVGLAAGVGYARPAVVATAMSIVALVALRPVRYALRRWGSAGPNELTIDGRVAPAAVLELLERRIAGRAEHVELRNEDDHVEITVRYADGALPLGDAIDALRDFDGVQSVRVGRG